MKRALDAHYHTFEEHTGFSEILQGRISDVKTIKMPPVSANVNIDLGAENSRATHLRMLLTTTRFQGIVRVRQMLHGNTCPHRVVAGYNIGAGNRRERE